MGDFGNRRKCREDRMLKAGVIAFGGGCLSAAASVAALFGASGGVVFAYLAPLPLLLVGLGLGSGATAIATATGVLTVAVFGGVPAAGVYGGMHALPSWLIVHQVLMQNPAGGVATSRSIGSVLCWLAVVGGVIATVTALVGRGEAGIEGSVRELLGAVASMASPNLTDADRDIFVGYLAPLFIGVSGVTWMLMLVVNAVLAQGVLARRGWNLRPTPNWSALTLPEWMAWPLVGTAVVALASSGDMGYMAHNLVLIFAAPYFFLGLAVVHSLARLAPWKGFVLAAFYVTLGLFLAFAGPAVVGLGVIEQWAGVRRRFVGPGPGQGSE
jgi:hypothetical protein